MEKKLEHAGTERDRVIQDLSRLRRFAGSPAEFWPQFMRGCVLLAGADVGLLWVRNEQNAPWRNLCIWPADATAAGKLSQAGQVLEEVAAEAAVKGKSWRSNQSGSGAGKGDGVVCGVRLELEDAGQTAAALFIIPAAGVLVDEILIRLLLVADFPAAYLRERIVLQARTDVTRFAETFDILAQLNDEKRYMGAAMTICNLMAARYHCDRVSLGWKTGDYLKMQAISHMEKFEKKMDAVRQLEAVMTEAMDQDEEIIWPSPAESTAITRDHEIFSKEFGGSNIISFPLRLEHKSIGAMTLERDIQPFSEDEVKNIRLVCDLAVRRLGDLKENDRWFGARAAAAVRDSLSKLWGVEHTFAKAVGVLVGIVLAVLLFGRLPYRVEAPFILKTDDLAYMPAAFDGYIFNVPVRVGDLVQEGDLLLTLDTRELLLEESTAIADLSRYSRETEKARAENNLAEMRIAQALADQARSKLDLVRYYLGNAEVRAPFTGVVVEGDLKEMLGAPVRKGDVLLKVAKLANMYLELDVDERDIHELRSDAGGEIAFVSRPEDKFPLQVERIDPVSQAKEEGNVFLVRARPVDGVVNWWRPGMSGLSKVDVGSRNILWIISHRTVDFLRLFFWW